MLNSELFTDFILSAKTSEFLYDNFPRLVKGRQFQYCWAISPKLKPMLYAQQEYVLPTEYGYNKISEVGIYPSLTLDEVLTLLPETIAIAKPKVEYFQVQTSAKNEIEQIIRHDHSNVFLAITPKKVAAQIVFHVNYYPQKKETEDLLCTDTNIVEACTALLMKLAVRGLY